MTSYYARIRISRGKKKNGKRSVCLAYDFNDVSILTQMDDGLVSLIVAERSSGGDFVFHFDHSIEDFLIIARIQAVLRAGRFVGTANEETESSRCVELLQYRNID